MALKLQVLPSAAREFAQFCEYGEEAAHLATQFRNEIMDAAAGKRPNLPTDISLEEFVDFIDSLPDGDETDPWSYSWRKLRDASWRERLRALWAFLRTRQPPWESRLAEARFTILGIVPIVFHAFYEINRPENRVVFTKFEWYGERQLDGAAGK